MTTEEPITLEIIAQKEGLALAPADPIVTALGPIFQQAAEWKAKAETIRITDVSQAREMKLARETRLALKELRVNAEKKHKELKADILMRGRAIDGALNIVKALVQPIEAHLKEQEEFAERKEQQRKDALKAERASALSKYGVDCQFYALGEMPEAAYSALLDSSRIAYEAKEEAARKAKEERIAREKAEAEERERVRLENERLKREAAEREAAMKAEREQVEAQRKAAEEASRREREAIEKKAREEAEKARIEREKIEAAARAEADRLRREQAEAAAKAKAERDAIEAKAKAEREAAEAQARREREARERIERQAAEEKARIEREQAERIAAQKEAARRAALAPDSDKVRAYAASIRALTLPSVATPEAVALVAQIKDQQEKFAQWLEKKATELSTAKAA